MNAIERRKNNRTYHRRLKAEIIKHYGGKCICCGECRLAFLTMDHIKGGGLEERRRERASLYTIIKRRELPTNEYQVMCFNCNLGRQYNKGICPHIMEFKP